MNDYDQYQDPAACAALVERFRSSGEGVTSTFEFGLLTALHVADRKQRAAIRKGYPHLVAAWEAALA